LNRRVSSVLISRFYTSMLAIHTPPAGSKPRWNRIGSDGRLNFRRAIVPCSSSPTAPKVHRWESGARIHGSVAGSFFKRLLRHRVVHNSHAMSRLRRGWQWRKRALSGEGRWRASDNAQPPAVGLRSPPSSAAMKTETAELGSVRRRGARLLRARDSAARRVDNALARWWGKVMRLVPVGSQSGSIVLPFQGRILLPGTRRRRNAQGKNLGISGPESGLRPIRHLRQKSEAAGRRHSPQVMTRRRSRLAEAIPNTLSGWRDERYLR